MNQSVRFMQQGDAARVAEIIRGNSITREASPVQLTREGFIVRLKTEEEIREYMDWKEDKWGYVLETDGKVAAVLLAEDVKGFVRQLNDGSCLDLHLQPRALEILSDPTTIDYSYIAKDHSMRCDIRELTDKFIEEAFLGVLSRKGEANYVIGKIYTAPVNNFVSMEYHKRQGFEELGKMDFRFKDMPEIRGWQFTASLMGMSREKYLQGRGKR
jgi:hypothetical protein